MLHELAKWLISAELPMYFVADAILSASSKEFEYFVALLSYVTDDQVSSWFLYNYIRRYASRYAPLESLFDLRSSLADVQKVLAALSAERQHSLNEICFDDFDRAYLELQRVCRQFIKSHEIIIEQLQSTDPRLTDFICALRLLHCVSMLECDHDISVVADIVLTSKLQLSDLPHFRRFSRSTSVSVGCRHFQVTSSLVRIVRFSSDDNLMKELCKVYCKLSSSCDCDFHKLSNSRLNVTMACLFYSTG